MHLRKPVFNNYPAVLLLKENSKNSKTILHVGKLEQSEKNIKSVIMI